MKKPEVDKIFAEAQALKLRKGLVVRSLDGRAFFLNEEELDRKAIPAEANAAMTKIFGKGGTGGSATAEYVSCDGMLQWLVTHDPSTEYWRRYSAIWIEYC